MFKTDRRCTITLLHRTYIFSDFSATSFIVIDILGLLQYPNNFSSAWNSE